MSNLSDQIRNAGLTETYWDNWIDEQERKKESGFFDLPKDKTCNHPNHNPPQHLYIPHGKGYRHKCPSCGYITTLIPPQISL